MWPFVKKNYFALDCLEGAILEDETSQFDHLIKAQPRIINQTNKEGFSGLHIAVHSRRRLMIYKLFDHGANPNVRTSQDFSSSIFKIPKGSTPLHIVAHHALLADLGISVAGFKPAVNQQITNFFDSQGAIPELKEIARMLLGHGARPDIRNKNGMTPLDVVHKMKGTDMFEWFVRHWK
jgi:ankyrin repeat protein